MPSATHTAVAIIRGHLGGTGQGIVREEFDNHDDEGDKYCQWYDRNERMWTSWLLRWAGYLILCSLRFLFLFFLFHFLYSLIQLFKIKVFHLLCVFISFFNASLLGIRQESCYDAEQWQEGTHLEDKLNTGLVG